MSTIKLKTRKRVSSVHVDDITTPEELLHRTPQEMESIMRKPSRERMIRDIACALREAKPHGPSIESWNTWSNTCLHVATVVCAPEGVTLAAFYDLCGLE